MKVLIVDDHPVIRHGMKQILDLEEDVSLVVECPDGKSMLEKLRNDEYNVVLLDISLPGISGLYLIPQIKKLQKKAGILIFSIHSEDVFALSALRSGVDGYITKSSPIEEVVRAIKIVAKGEKYISPYMAARLAESVYNNGKKNLLPKLSVRELQVLDEFAKGKSIKEIAGIMKISSKTVGTYRERLLSKLNLRSTSELIRYAVLHGSTRT